MKKIKFILRIILLVFVLNIIVCAGSVILGEKNERYRATYVREESFNGNLH